MAASSLTFETLCATLKKGDYKPVYLLHGEERYFTDAVLGCFEKILTEEEKEFNQYTLYGLQTPMEEVIDICRRFPMMADRQVVLLKDAQNVRADQLERLAKYVLNPSPQTILVIAFRGEAAKGRELLAALRKTDAVTFESKKIREADMPGYITDYLNKRGLNVQPKAVEILNGSIGADLSKLFNELDKLVGILGQGATVTPEAVEQHIGVSKDYNPFELVDALAMHDGVKAMRIAGYFRSNPKSAPIPLVTTSIFGLFSDLLVFQSAKDRSDSALLGALGLKWPSQLKRLREASRHYNAWQSIEIIRAIRRFDAQTKGIASRRDSYDLLQELVFRIITAPGTLFPKY